MAGVKISQLQDGGALQATDAFPVARGSFTRKILGAQLLDPLQNLDTRLNALSSNTIYVVDSPTIDLSYNSSTRTLSADLTSSVSLVPTGAVMTFPSTAAPTGWLALSGQTVLRSEYPSLWTFAQSSGNIVTDTSWYSTSAIGSFSQGNGSTTFRIPDLRGEFVRGWDNGRGVDAGRTVGSWQKGTIFGHDNTAGPYAVVGMVYTNGNLNQNITLSAMGLDSYETLNYPNIAMGSVASTLNSTLPQFAGDSGSSGVTRPRNTALLYCIKT